MMKTSGRASKRLALLAAVLSAYCLASTGAPSLLERPSEGVVVVQDDEGNWGGDSMGITHQRGPDYWAKKVLDLGALPEEAWAAANEVRLSAFFCVRDYSWHDLPAANGLDETFEIVVNGKAHPIKTSSGVPAYDENKPMSQFMQWYDFVLPKEEFVRGPNEVVFRMMRPENKNPDDYLYLGIDNTVPGGNSWVKFGAQDDWRQDQLNVPGGKGEYMVRLYLLAGTRELEAAWFPIDGRTEDAKGLILYAGSHGGETVVEWNPLRFDRLAPLRVTLETDGNAPFTVAWLDPDGKPTGETKATGPAFTSELPAPLLFRPSGVRVDKGVAIRQLKIHGVEDYHPLPKQVDMAPIMAPPRGSIVERMPSCEINGNTITLANKNLTCAFSNEGERLRFVSLYNELAASEMARPSGASALFLVEVGGKRYAGSTDFRCASVSPMTEQPGFTATLLCESLSLEAAMRVWIDDALRMGLTVTNRGQTPVDFKVAFPHLSGLALSDDPAKDYYFFPWGGGIMSDAPTLIRRGYGEHAALYQLIDLFSPEHGAGLAVRCTDTDGAHKVLALRKHVDGMAEMNGDAAHTPTADEYKWTNCLPQTPGIGVTFEYLRRTRGPGEAFSAKDIAIEAHPSDWHVPMAAYAGWLHKTWTFRPRPSALTRVVNMIADGWGQSTLFKDGAYRTDFIKPRCDCIELMSWWEWSELGPWRTPWDRLLERMGEADYKQYTPYFVKDAVTGNLMYTLNRGDYDGYNVRWGGLPALQNAIKTYRGMGALVTLYTDPLLADDNTKCGQQWGKLWGIVQPNGEYSTNYHSWNMCHDVAEYRQYVADTMRRVMQETGADGIRLDEYGHAGAACFNKQHAHTFAEWGCTEWLRAISEATKMVRQAMDEVKPGSVLTTEHPGYDYLMQFIEGCITYDLTVQATELRPLECNLQRFYFPECKAFELDHRGADPLHRKRFWNAVASFGSYYPPNMDAVLRENADAFESGDCTPLIPTLARQVYANEFRAPGKRIVTLYNAAGHRFYGGALHVEFKDGEHLVDLLTGREAELAPDIPGMMNVFLQRDDVMCVAQLPARLAVQETPEGFVVAVKDAAEGAEVCLCDKDGGRLVSKPAAAEVRILKIELPADSAAPICVKLLKNGMLVDIAATPSAQ